MVKTTVEFKVFNQSRLLHPKQNPSNVITDQMFHMADIKKLLWSYNKNDKKKKKKTCFNSTVISLKTRPSYLTMTNTHKIHQKTVMSHEGKTWSSLANG